jgi:hypothetical protein
MSTMSAPAPAIEQLSVDDERELVVVRAQVPVGELVLPVESVSA